MLTDGAPLHLSRWVPSHSYDYVSYPPKHMINCLQGVARVVIGVQLVIAGFQLPAKYQLREWIPMMICLLPVMTIMWLFTTGCILLTVPKLTLVGPAISTI